jgi:hypothetical protein
MRRVKLPDLLIEVDNQLGFTRNFLTLARREEPCPENICAVLAAVMAHGCNLGVYTMAQLTSDVTYEQLNSGGARSEAKPYRRFKQTAGQSTSRLEL